MQPHAPSLIVPGAGKSGTTTLYHYLAQHPDIDMARNKEPQLYSSAERHVRRFDPDFADSFASIFDWHKEARYRGEASTTYLVSAEAPRRICEDTPDVKLIFVLRNPIDRIVSHYNWIRMCGVPVKAFRDEICADVSEAGVVFDARRHHKGGIYKYYLTESLYGCHLERYLGMFRRENLHVITFESLKADYLGTVNTCFRFLELPTLNTLAHTHAGKTELDDTDLRPAILRRAIRAAPRLFTWARAVPGVHGAYKRAFYRKAVPYKPTASERAWLVDELQADVQLLGRLLGREFPEWKDFTLGTQSRPVRPVSANKWRAQ